MYPSRIFSDASRQIRSSPSSSACTPPSEWKVVEMVAAGNWRWVTWRIVSRSALLRIGVGTSSRLAWAGPCSSRLPPAPRLVARDMTSSSRIGSMGGLVTWAKSCLKYAKRLTGRSLSTARGASLPIEPTGSSPSRAIGARTSFSSSSV